jgi:hypothetical protein
MLPLHLRCRVLPHGPSCHGLFNAGLFSAMAVILTHPEPKAV